MKSGSIQRNNAKGLAHGGNARRGCVREWSRFGITARPNPSAQFFSEHAHWWDVNRYPASFWLLSSSWGYGSSLFHQNEIQTILTLFLLMKNSICIAMSHGRLSIPSLSWPPLNPQDRCTPPLVHRADTSRVFLRWQITCFRKVYSCMTCSAVEFNVVSHCNCGLVCGEIP